MLLQSGISRLKQRTAHFFKFYDLLAKQINGYIQVPAAAVDAEKFFGAAVVDLFVEGDLVFGERAPTFFTVCHYFSGFTSSAMTT